MSKETNMIKQDTKKEIRMEDYIEGFDLVQDEQGKITSIDVFVSNGDCFPAPYTKENLEKLRNNMLEHAAEESKTLEQKKSVSIGYKVLAGVGAAGFAIINITGFGKEIASNFPATLCLGVGIASGIGAFKNDRKIAEITRNATFAFHKDDINAGIIENPYVFSNIDPKDKEQIECWLDYGTKEPIAIENIYKLKPETINIIWKNIKLSKQFGMECNKEQGFQKTLR